MACTQHYGSCRCTSMTSEKHDKMTNWLVLGSFALALVPLWTFSRDFTRPAPSTALVSSKPYVFPSSNATIDVSGHSRIQIGMGRFAGLNSINCGTVNPYTNKRRIADSCAVAALQAHRPFRLIYQTGDRHEIKNWGVAGNAKGQVFFLRNVEPMVGINNYVTGETLYMCKRPIVVTINGLPRIACHEKRNLTP